MIHKSIYIQSQLPFSRCEETAEFLNLFSISNYSQISSANNYWDADHSAAIFTIPIVMVRYISQVVLFLFPKWLIYVTNPYSANCYLPGSLYVTPHL